jgi:maltooligosyltrehalose trehalohydrolase
LGSVVVAPLHEGDSVTDAAARLGATHMPDGTTRFIVWAPQAERVDVRLGDGRAIAMERAAGDAGERGYFGATVEGAGPGTRYTFVLDGDTERADPASRHQPDGVHGPSAVVGDDFPWSDADWRGRPLAEYVVYELHVGTFTEDGTFDGAISRLDDLVDLGITAVEVMPVAEFPGGRNWGYDGVFPYAAQSTYGGPDGLRRFVDACHGRGLAVILDVVYNHFGPEGAVQGDFGPYHTDRYGTPWGPAINFDDRGSDEVRRYVIDNALWWIEGCHVDALRLDAVHAIYDQSATHILAQLADRVAEVASRLGRLVHLVAESDLNDPRLVHTAERGGYGPDAQWSDDFHHALHAVLTGEDDGYYRDFGRVADLAGALRQGYVYVGQYSRYRGRSHGAPPDGVPGERFVVCAQNHDQVGNRMEGERLAALVEFDALKVAATCVVLSPFIPMLFMGEEYGEPAPFLYFVSHTDPDLVEAVRSGRKEEFSAFRWAGEPPDPQAEETFLRSRLDHGLKSSGGHAALLAYHRRLFEIRRTHPALSNLDRDRIEVDADEGQRLLSWRRWTDDGDEVVTVVRLGDDGGEPTTCRIPPGQWTVLVDAADEGFGGPGSSLRGDEPEVSVGPYGAFVLGRRAG